MKKITFLLTCILGFATYGQVIINEDFESDNGGFTGTFFTTGTQSCSGDSMRDNVYTAAGGNFTSPNQVGASNATDLSISFDYKIVQYSSTTTATTAGWGSADLEYSTDDGTTWNNVYTIDDSNHTVANTCANVTATVTAANLPNASDVKLRLNITYGTGDYYFYVDDFAANQVVSTPPNCPANVMSTPDAGCGNYDVPVTWDASTGAVGYKISVGTTSGGTDIENLTDLGSSLTYTVAGPSLNTTYYYKVVAYNGAGDSTGCAEASFTSATTGCYCTSAPTSNDGTGIGNLQVGTTDFASGGDIMYEDFTGSPVDLAQGITSNVVITFMTNYTYDTHIWIDLNDDFNFEASELLYSGESADSNTGTDILDASFTMPAGAALGTHRMRIGTADTGQATANACYSGSYGVTMDVDVNVIAPTCSPSTASGALVDNCAASQQFSVDVDVTVLGDATQINDGTTTYAVSATGTVTVGPYATGTSVTLTMEHSDVTCNYAIGTYTIDCPPSNDDCANATAIACGDNVTGSTSLATDSGGNTAEDVFYVYSDAAAKDVTVDLCASGYDTNVRIYTDCTLATEVASNDDFCGTRSQVTFPAAAGTSYYIMVEGYGTSDGAYDMTISCVAPTPPPANNECATAEALTIATTATGTTAGATQNTSEEQPTCDGFGSIADVWYSVVVGANTADLTITTTLTDTSDQANVAIYSACGGLQADQVGCSDGNGGETVTVTSPAAGTYYVRVWSDGAAPPTAGRTEGGFGITANVTLSTTDLENPSAFTYYPNPVNNILTLNAQNTIENVTVLNMLGQVVARQNPNTMDSNLDMSNLQSGAYFVKVTIANTTQTVKIIKQ